MDLSGKTLFIANRGEIAIRINRAAKALGGIVVQVHFEADMLAVRLAGDAYETGTPQAVKSYLNIDRLLEAANHSGADAVRPCYGFLSANAKFVHAVAETTGTPYSDWQQELVPQTRSEGQAAIGDHRVCLERSIESARHVEAQILCDGERASTSLDGKFHTQFLESWLETHLFVPVIRLGH